MFVAVLGTAYVMLPQNPTVSTVTQSSNNTASVGTTIASSYTMTTVTQHNTAYLCWAAINGNVYDLTNWINQHPGGQGPILSLCGTDGSAAFNGQHGGQARPASELKNFLLGPLAS